MFLNLTICKLYNFRLKKNWSFCKHTCNPRQNLYLIHGFRLKPRDQVQSSTRFDHLPVEYLRGQKQDNDLERERESITKADRDGRRWDSLDYSSHCSDLRITTEKSQTLVAATAAEEKRWELVARWSGVGRRKRRRSKTIHFLFFFHFFLMYNVKYNISQLNRNLGVLNSDFGSISNDFFFSFKPY